MHDVAANAHAWVCNLLANSDAKVASPARKTTHTVALPGILEALLAAP